MVQWFTTIFSQLGKCELSAFAWGIYDSCPFSPIESVHFHCTIHIYDRLIWGCLKKMEHHELLIYDLKLTLAFDHHFFSRLRP